MLTLRLNSSILLYIKLIKIWKWKTDDFVLRGSVTKVADTLTSFLFYFDTHLIPLSTVNISLFESLMFTYHSQNFSWNKGMEGAECSTSVLIEGGRLDLRVIKVYAMVIAVVYEQPLCIHILFTCKKYIHKCFFKTRNAIYSLVL